MEQSGNSIGVFTTDRNLVIQIWDSTLARFTGIAADKAIGHPLLDILPDLYTRGLKKHFDRVLAQGVVEILAPAFHQHLMRCAPTTPSKRFPTMRQRVTIAPLEEDNAVAGVIVTIEDVTARHDAELDMLERLQQGGDSLLSALEDKSWRVRRAAVDEVSRNAAPDAISALLIWVRDNHHNLGLLNSALKVLTLCNVDTHATLVGFLSSPDDDLRIQAALALGQLGDLRGVPPLLASLKDPNTNVVYHAIEALGRLRALEAVEPLVSIAETRDFFLAFPALEALGSIGDSRAASRVVPLLQHELLRDAAAHTLAQIGEESTVATLVALLNAPNAPTDAVAASLAILYDRYQRNFGEGRHIADLCRLAITPTALQQLLDALAQSRPENLRPLLLVLGWQESPAAMRALTLYLGRLELRDEIIELLAAHGTAVTELLIPHLKSEDLDVRFAAIKAMGRIKDKRAVSALVGILGNEDELTIPAIAALSAIGDRRAVDSLFALLGTADAAIRRAAVSALNVLASPELVPRVTPLLEDDSPGVREAAVRIAGYFGYKQSIDPLLRRCDDTDEAVRRAAIEHLPYLEDDRVSATLARALRKDTPSVRAAAAAGLAHVEATEAIPALLDSLADPESWVRYYTARSLGKHRTREAAATLQDLAANDKSPQVRIAAFEALEQIDPERALTVAKTFLAQSDVDIARAAAAAAARLPHEIAFPLLEEALRSPHDIVRATAATALGESENPEALHLLRSLAVTDKEASVTNAAVFALSKLSKPAGTAALIDLLNDPLLQETAMTALSQPADLDVEALSRGLQHPSVAVRIALVGVVERLKRPQTSDLLRLALQDSHPSVRVAAAGALNRNGRLEQ